MSGNSHEDLKISFEDSNDDYDDGFVNVTVTEHSSRDKVYVNQSLSKLKNLKLKSISAVIIAQLNDLRNKFDFFKEIMIGFVDVLVVTESKLD